MKILIIQQKMIGDVLTCSILFKAIKEVFPNSELHYLINSHTFPVVENNPYIDEFVFFTPKNEKSKYQLLLFIRQIRKRDYDVIIDAYSQISSNLMTLFSKAKTKISTHRWYTSFLYHYPVKYYSTPKTNAGLAIENRLQLLGPLNITPKKLLKPKIYLTESEKNSAKDYLIKNGINLSKPVYMISVTGSSNIKTYRFSFMAKTIDVISKEKPQAQILFNYIPNLAKDARSIYDLCHEETQKHIYFNVFGKNLREFLAITLHCNAVIGNEGGAINMAKALEIPTFAIFSPWIDKATWAIFENESKNVSVHLKDYKPELYQDTPEKEMKPQALELYDAFLPNLFFDKLTLFLNGILD